MPYVIATDEAGYGPNLGPLVVSATVWELAEGVEIGELYHQLRRVVTKSVEKANKKRVVWADSKVVYKGGDGIDHLERGVLAALALLNQLPSQWAELWCLLDPFCGPRLELIPWHAGYSATLPMWLEEDGLSELVESVRRGLEAAGVRLAALLSRAIFPDEFNATVGRCKNKADALSRITLSLVADALKSVESGPVHVLCDKHGGRNRYGPLVQSQFPDDWVQRHYESSAQSTYRFGPEERRVEIEFWVEGERFLPVALSSMVSKYLRETAMRPFNEFWRRHIPDLAPTAGYPVDSHRFRKQIAGVQRKLGIEDAVLWRER